MTSLLDAFIESFFDVAIQIAQAEAKREQEAKRKFNFPDAINVEYRVIDDGK